MAPNPIDMDTVFKELNRLDKTGNFGVLLTIIFVFLFYIIAIVLAKRADRRDQAKVTRSSKIFKNFSLSSSNTRDLFQLIPNLENKTMVVLSPERTKPFNCKTILLFVLQIEN